METLPGIASVLRSPVADAFVGVIRAGARLADFSLADAEEIFRYAVRRNLMAQEETDRVLAEVRAAVERRAEREAARKAALHTAGRRHAAKGRPRPKSKARSQARGRSAPTHKAGGKHKKR
jgi:hypothetical protein